MCADSPSVHISWSGRYDEFLVKGLTEADPSGFAYPAWFLPLSAPIAGLSAACAFPSCQQSMQMRQISIASPHAGIAEDRNSHAATTWSSAFPLPPESRAKGCGG
jgi:hypothetical protein